MNFKPFFIYDRVIIEGRVVVFKDECVAIPDCIQKGLVVVRHLDESRYELTLNKCLENEIIRLERSDLTNKRRRQYQLLDRREIIVLDLLLARLQNTEIREFTEVLMLPYWHLLLVNGKHEEYSGQNDFGEDILDWLLWNHLAEYDCRGYYSPNADWIHKIKEKDKVSMSAAQKLIKCFDEKIVAAWMSSIGYTMIGRTFHLEETHDSPWLLIQ